MRSTNRGPARRPDTGRRTAPSPPDSVTGVHGRTLHCGDCLAHHHREGTAAAHPREDRTTVQLRVVTDQPWDVKADVLVIPVVGDPIFEGPLDELDRRAGGEIRALAGFKELTGKRYSTTLATAGELPARRLVLVGAGEGGTIDREV